MKLLIGSIAILGLFSLCALAHEHEKNGPCAPYVEKCKSQGLHWGDGKMMKCVHEGAANDQACMAKMKAHAEEWKEHHHHGGKDAPAQPSTSAPAPAPAAGN